MTQSNARRRAATQEKLAQQRAAQRRTEGRRTYLFRGTLGLVVAAVVAGLVLLGLHGSTSTPAASSGPEGAPVPAGAALAAATTPAGRTVDGVSCLGSEQLLFHIHAHLAVFVDGAARQVPAGVGIVPPRQVQQAAGGQFVTGGACFYWLHTHAADGIIHIESPVRRTFTLGTFFDVWRQPLSADQVAGAHGPVTAYLDGRRWTGNPRSIPLAAHAVIQLDVGTPLVPPRAFTFPSGL